MSNNDLSIENESDVEQKIIFPFLTEAPPLGLGYARSSIRTKPDLRQFRIGKGSSEKLYYPDYLILQNGLPVFLVEAKCPSGNISEGYREARLYATELNSSLGTKVNPLQRIASTDGENWLFGFWDSEPDIRITTQSFEISNVHYA